MGTQILFLHGLAFHSFSYCLPRLLWFSFGKMFSVPFATLFLPHPPYASNMPTTFSISRQSVLIFSTWKKLSFLWVRNLIISTYFSLRAYIKYIIWLVKWVSAFKESRNDTWNIVSTQSMLLWWWLVMMMIKMRWPLLSAFLWWQKWFVVYP